MKKPLFIPLNKAPYGLFCDGRKTYELRRLGGQWTEKHVWMGRRATLSYGYGKRFRRGGMVMDVKIADSVAHMFTRLPYKFVLPTADAKIDAIVHAENMLFANRPKGRVIAFEVVTDERLNPFDCPVCLRTEWCWDGMSIGSKFECTGCGSPLVIGEGGYDKHLSGNVPALLYDYPITLPVEACA